MDEATVVTREQESARTLAEELSYAEQDACDSHGVNRYRKGNLVFSVRAMDGGLGIGLRVLS